MKIGDFTYDEIQNALDEAHAIMNPVTETNEERLEEVKKSAKWLHCFMGPVDVNSISEDMNWLIEQAERVPGLEKDIEALGMAFGDSANDLVKARREIKLLQEVGRNHISMIEMVSINNQHLREVLAFYADSKNYEVNVVDQWAPEIKVMMDGGAKAAELLGELK